MKRVLFVDDEPSILQGLKRMLRGMRKEWEMTFSEDSAAALAVMEDGSFDVVVSDMRMPGMDGADLLTETKRLYPDTVRIILSGHSETESILKAVGSTHQYLAKPCDSDTLKSVVDQACTLKENLESERVRKLIAQIQNLPSMPTLFHEIVSELQKPDGSLHKVGKIIESDVSMSAKILKLVNSAYFGTARPMSSVGDAVIFLGLETINSLVLGASVFTKYEDPKIPGFSIESLWQHSMRTAQFVKIVARLEGLEKRVADDAFMAGMLHSIGKLVLVTSDPDAYREVLEQSARDEQTLADAERTVFGATHSEVGAHLMGLWGLPNPIVHAIAYYERPRESDSSELGPLVMLHAANALVLEAEATQNDSSMVVDSEYLELLGLQDRWPVWQQACKESMQEVDHP